MDNATVIANVETLLPKETINGRYIRGPINVPLKTFLEEVLVNFISPGSTIDQVLNYIETKVLPDVVPETKVIDVSIDFGALENKDVQSREEPKDASIEQLAPIVELEQNTFIPINPLLGKECVDEFIKNCVGFVASVRTSEVVVVDTREYLYSKIAFMNSEQKILIGESYKSIDEVYNILLNNSYRPATLVDKTELCSYLAEQLEPEVLASTIKELNMTTREYILEVIPKMMINATEIAISGNIVSVDKIIDQMAKKQREMLEKEREKENNERLEEFNRTGENPSLLSEIKLELDKEDAIEVTAEIPIVSSYLVTPEEVAALSVLPTDRIYGNDDLYYQSMLNNLKQTIRDTTNEHDLTTKESGNNNFSFEAIAQEALQKIPTFEMQQLINSTSELIGTKRNELIKVYSNQEEYCDAIMMEISTITRKLELVDSIDSFSEIKNQITRLTIDLVAKNIKDMRVKQALDDLNTAYRQAFTKYNLTQNDFEKQKNGVVEKINNRLSDIRRNYASLIYIKDISNYQSMVNSTNLNIEALKGEIEQAVSTHLLTEEEVNTYYYELNRLNTLGTVKNRLGT